MPDSFGYRHSIKFTVMQVDLYDKSEQMLQTLQGMENCLARMQNNVASALFHLRGAQKKLDHAVKVP